MGVANRNMRAQMRTFTMLAVCGVSGAVVGHFVKNDSTVHAEPTRNSLATDSSPGDAIDTAGVWAIFTAIEAADDDDTALAQLAENAQSQLDRRIVISRWVRVNPSAALAWGRSKPGLEAAHLVFEEWAKTDPYTAINTAREDTSPQSSQFARRILNTLANAHPAAFFHAVESLKKANPLPAAWDFAFAGLFSGNSEDALQAFRQLSQQNQNASSKAFGRQWAKFDPRAALAWSENMKSGSDTRSGVLEGLAVTDPMTAVRLSKSRMDGELRTAIFEGFSTWSPEQVMDACIQFEADGESDSFGTMSGAVQRVLHRALTNSPDQAFRLIERIPEPNLRKEIITHFTERSNLNDMSSVMPWLETQALPENTLVRLGASMAAKLFYPDTNSATKPDPAALASRLGDGPLKDALQDAINADLAVLSGDYATFAAWVETLNSEGEEIASAHIWRLKDESIESAVTLEAFVGGAFVGDGPEFLSEWFRRDPLAAQRWAENLPAGIKNSKAPIIKIAELLAAYDPAKAATWATGLSGTARTAAMAEVANDWTRQDPSAAVEWATNIDDLDLQARACGSIAHAWIDDDPYSATEWLASLERGELRDRTILGMAASERLSSEMELSTRTAIKWLADVDQPELRRSALTRLVGEDQLLYSPEERPATEVLLHSVGVSDEDIEAIYSEARQKKAAESSNAEPASDSDDPFG
ncbi:MAG: hypothetical protein ACI9R3_004623 [Verrucomicrobiales bacterium]|jgi:hypothetical protein